MKTLNKLAMATAIAALTSGAAMAETTTYTTTTTSTNAPYIATSTNAQSQIRLNSTQVRALQQALRSEGYNISVDGIWGLNTASALRSYQSASQLAITGQANRETLAKLNLNSDAFYNTNMASNTNVKAQSALTLSRAEVRDLQAALRAEGYNIGVDGIWGPNTASALRSFQTSSNLAVTGQANRETLAKLNMNSNSYFNSDETTRADMKAQTSLRLNSTEVRGLQQALRAQGYNIGVDGVWGPNTAGALRSFQSRSNLAVTGQANRETLAELNLLPGSTTTTTASTTTTTTTGPDIQAQTALRLDSGEVRSLQQALRNEGYTGVGVNGFMDQPTVDALRSFQTSNNLAVTGRANFETLASLDLLANSSANTSVASSSLIPSIVQLSNGEARLLQQALNSEGYNIGIDGIIGQGTINTLRDYQAANNLSATGQLDQETLVSLQLLDALMR